ncbi:VapC toxin family PIN domain ribonuclease [Streptomyces sp. NBC_00053]|uniref:PIN domain-containing protein n=1 Tax=unclassified Streptomyces TaxID=2593676 RepID=UPI000F5BA1D4|nr:MULTISPECIES: PIN domain-containing protein [unclassified Streptomyces]WSG50551.1 VapC toxin family PIN domain ribonuclease [Streptomyces sp. NBC_01732]WSX01207.1 VapC toxin family PIN domain ribonuclease [Streptomyces sp. NBC_00987]MCX5500216.1 VapC toxin family PIN domain ribonuclease [Streptomyces sp. NBC_00052]MCX5551248.1 VapC toxin family PIN domain ribonuclease [Streptomyces sp. NBC_00051]RPK72912.1 hypothetical protein EES42_10845 [Streptomyces sp. ADI95-17]
MRAEHGQGLLDANVMILRRWVDPEELPAQVAISAVTPAELSAGPHEVRRNEEQDDYDEYAGRARRLDVLQRAENEFDPIPFDAEAARIYGRACAAVIGAGRKPRRRVADLMIASIAITEELPHDLDYGRLFHGVDERVPLEGLRFGVRVMTRLWQSC